MNSTTPHGDTWSGPAGTLGEAVMSHIGSFATQSGHDRMAACILQAAPEAASQGRCFAWEACAGWRVSGDTRESLRMIVSELVTNAATHSGSDCLALMLRTSTHSIQIEVIDSGQWQNGPQEAFAECGRGLQIVEALSERVAFLPMAVGTRVRVDLSIASGDRHASPEAAHETDPYEEHALAGIGT
jgi:anti-sigma regulatory factor (Ser/Thr protein kinase)